MAGDVRAKLYGFVEWFRPGENERVEQVVDGLLEAGVGRLRTHLSWAEYHRPGGQEWYDWLLPTLGRRLELLPCVHYTPPSLSRTGLSSGPPHQLRDYADFIDLALTRYGHCFSHVELWNEPNNLLDWDWRVDHDWQLFSEMIGDAAHWAQQRGWQVVLGGPAPFDRYWLDLMGKRGVLANVAAVGCHGFPGTWDSEAATWRGWGDVIHQTRDVLRHYNPAAEVWITEAGYATWRHDEAAQVARFLDAYDAPADRLYWYGWQDLPIAVPVQEGHYFDPRHYHLGATDARGRPKLLRRLLASGGLAAARSAQALQRPAIAKGLKAKIVLGGAGFIGANLAHALLRDGEDVIVLDNLSRDGVEGNLAWLQEAHGDHVHPVIADLRNETALDDVMAEADAVFHLAAQVAVTTSIDDPVDDFTTNAYGTLAVLEAVRRAGRRTPVVFASTNKVYGALGHLEMAELDQRYVPVDDPVRRFGIGETQPLDFCTPYGCSKGVADQYVLDYAKTYDLQTAVLRMSCIYGPRQLGTEDQGWVAHFLRRVLAGEPITVFGNGKQVRDILHVDDAVAAYRGVLAGIDHVSGRAFNLGGGPGNTVSLLMVLDEIRRLTGIRPRIAKRPWRTGDQLYFAADTRALQEAVGWRPSIRWREGIADLAIWVAALSRDSRRPPKTFEASALQAGE